MQESEPEQYKKGEKTPKIKVRKIMKKLKRAIKVKTKKGIGQQKKEQLE